MQWTGPGRGPLNSNSGAHQNNNYGRDHNINHHGYQNINSVGQVVGGEVNAAGRDIINNFSSTGPSPFDRLVSVTAGVGASHKAEQQFERGNCLPGTRVESLRLIYDWRSSKQQKHPICWLSGPAGVGKSAIAMTVAKDCEKEGSLASSFFFFRSDPKRNNPSMFIPTIAHDLASMTPLIQNHIEQKISNDPRILEAALEVQFCELILEPVLSWSRKRLPWGFFTDLPGSPVVSNIVVIDGLDECGDEETQTRILSIIQSAYQQAPHFPLRFLICSRPESWLQEAFADEPLFQLSKGVVLDDSLAAHEDIRRYLRHHFHEIVTSRKYSQVRFPTPWPSNADLETLVEWSCGQFIFVATVIKFIKSAFRQPIEQLRIIIKKILPRRPGASPYQQLDLLYNFVLSVNPDYEEVRPILAAILTIPDTTRTPACIELLLELPIGQVAATLRGMHSVLDIRGSGDEIRIFHTSFRDYLLDQTRSGCFHIDVDTQEPILARQWLQNLTSSKVRSYNSYKLYSKDTGHFFTDWMNFCPGIRKPTDELFDIRRTRHNEWYDVFNQLNSWVWNRHVQGISQNEDEDQSGDCGGAEENMRPKAKGYPSYAKGQCAVEAHSRGMDKGDGPALVERFVQKLQNYPGCFHLEWSSGVSPRNDVNHSIVHQTTRCPGHSQLDMSPPSDIDEVHLTDCHCDLSRGNEPCDPAHIAYQEACMELFKALVSRFEIFYQSGAEGITTIDELGSIFSNIVGSLLLKHCQLDMELLSLCQTFFGLANGCLVMRIEFEKGKAGRKNVLEWIELSSHGPWTIFNLSKLADSQPAAIGPGQQSKNRLIRFAASINTSDLSISPAVQLMRALHLPLWAA
ncbi:hypothetical protein PQX77_019662 [Marasmius sp. AFHP31]|nr:hypothetical protein PQX77_019662 [Marasmius sp. AFHP31]